ncbi:MAG: hypothetical protein OXU74_05640 [Gemmatimonadota bacterium]|nr:hypothetical protein [Gemmatimonadota bacterium]
MDHPEQDYTTEIKLYLNACPGPPMLRAALRVAALQDVEGIPGLFSPDRKNHRDVSIQGLPGGGATTKGAYVRTVAGVAEILDCRPEYLSDTALRQGFSMSVALRWIRLSHGVALRNAGVGITAIAWRLGFSDRAGWHRFTVTLVGKTPAQLPAVPVSFWAREAVRAVFLTTPKLRGMPVGKENMGDDNAGP